MKIQLGMRDELGVGGLGLGGGAPAPTVARLWDDQFTDTVAAGSVNGTTTTPGGQTRGAVDTANHLSVTGGRMRFNQYVTQGDNPRFYSTAFTRAQGLAMAFDFYVNTDYPDAFIWGWMTSQSTGVARFTSSVYFHSGDGNVNHWNGTTQTGISTDFAASSQRKFVIVLRATGAYVVQASADLTTWTLRYVSAVGSTATLYVGGGNRISAAGTNCEVDNVVVGQLGDGWLSDAYSATAAGTIITGRDAQWLDALC